MFYNINMNSRFDLGFYLNTLFPKRKNGFSKEDFLNELFFDIIDKFNLRDKNDSIYVVGKELTSRLFHNKCDLPAVLQNGVKKIKNDSEFSKSIFKVIGKYVDESNYFYCYSCLCNQVLNDIRISNDDKNKCKYLLENNNYEKLNFNLFLYSCLSSNRRENIPTKMQGRPRKTKEKDGFFYLSESEKKKRAEYFVGYLQNINNHLNIDNLHELLDIISYYKLDVGDKTMKNIARNFIKCWKKSSGISIAENIWEYFDGAAMTFPNKKDRFIRWKKYIYDEAALLEISKMKKLLSEAIKSGDFTLASKEIYDNFFDDDFYIRSGLFRKKFVLNNFLLPNFFEHITRSEWTYCHNVATISAKMNLSEPFESYINKLKSLSDENDTISDRCNALVEKCKFNNY